MDGLVWHERPLLDRPVLLVAMAGWSDAGNAATAAASLLVTQRQGRRFAEIPPHDFYVFTVVRPWVRQNPDGSRRIEWPVSTFYALPDPAGATDLVVLIGTEPSLRWAQFSRLVLELAQTLAVRHVLTLGAYLGDVRHFEPPPVSGWTSDEAVRARFRPLRIDPITYEGPTAYITTLGVACAEAGLPVTALWTALPSYLGPTPNPKGALALLQAVDRLFALGLDLRDLEQSARRFETEVTRLLLRRQREATSAPREPAPRETAAPEPPAGRETPPTPELSGPPDLPSPQEAVREVEDFLRRLREEQ